MAAASGTQDPPVTTIASDVEQRLHEEPFAFDFFQAVRVLERLQPGRVPVGRFADPGQEVVRFRVNPTLAFPASQIQSLQDAPAGQPEMTVNFMGLTGPIGALPLFYTELIIARMQARDHTLREFFDIFHHRIISLFFGAWQKYRFPSSPERGALDRLSQYLLDLIGLGTKALRDRQAVDDRSLIYYAGLLAQQPRSAAALRLLLSDYFQVPVEVEQFVGAWYRLDQDAQCCLEVGSGDSRQLGVGAVVGDEIWEPQARVRLVLGPLSLSQYLDFLPTGSAYKPLRSIARLFAGDEIDFELRLILDRDETPACELGAQGDTAPQLGFLSWAKSKPIDRDPGDTILQL